MNDQGNIGDTGEVDKLTKLEQEVAEDGKVIREGIISLAESGKQDEVAKLTGEYNKIASKSSVLEELKLEENVTELANVMEPLEGTTGNFDKFIKNVTEILSKINSGEGIDKGELNKVIKELEDAVKSKAIINIGDLAYRGEKINNIGDLIDKLKEQQKAANDPLPPPSPPPRRGGDGGSSPNIPQSAAAAAAGGGGGLLSQIQGAKLKKAEPKSNQQPVTDPKASGRGADLTSILKTAMAKRRPAMKEQEVEEEDDDDVWSD